jgi:hypothetical protein
MCGVGPRDAHFVGRREDGRQGQQEAEQGNYEGLSVHSVMIRPISLAKDNSESRFLQDLNLLPF